MAKVFEMQGPVPTVAAAQIGRRTFQISTQGARRMELKRPYSTHLPLYQPKYFGK